MNKILFFGIVACGACTSWAGSQTISQVVAPSLPLERHVVQPFSITGSAGFMYEQVGSFTDKSGASYETLPSLLYGGSLGIAWDYLKTGKAVHSLGFSAGYYAGSQSNGMYEYMRAGHPWLDFSAKTHLNVIPLTLSYNMKWDLTNSVVGFLGARGGMMIRTTKIDGSDSESENWNPGRPHDNKWRDVSSTKILPMCGIGAGVQTYISSRWTFSVSADFLWTFGRDCGQLLQNVGNNPAAARAVTRDSRFYAVFNVGLTYSF